MPAHPVCPAMGFRSGTLIAPDYRAILEGIELACDLRAALFDLREQKRALVELAGYPLQVPSAVLEGELYGVQGVHALVVVMSPLDELAGELAHGAPVEQHAAAVGVRGVVRDHSRDVAQVLGARELLFVGALADCAEVGVAHAGGEHVVVFQDLRHLLDPSHPSPRGRRGSLRGVSLQGRGASPA